MNIEHFTIPVDHPCLPGHFPDRPVVPAVVLLDEVIAAVCKYYPGRLANLSRCKFLRPLEPGVTCEITLENDGEGKVLFTCADRGALLARGQLGLESSPNE